MRWLVLLALPCLLQAEVTRIHIVERTDVLDGKPLGPAGSYEKVIAKARFALDPKLPANRLIHDLGLAAHNAQGKVEFSADLYVLKPRDPAQGNGVLLFEVSNRGGKGLLGRFNAATGSLDPSTPEQFGDLWLMKQGYTLVWLGWQWDLPNTPGLLRLDAPRVQGVTGPVRAEFVPNAPAAVMPLADRNHQAYPPVQGTHITLTQRTEPEGKPTPIAQAQWSVSPDGQSIAMASGFKPGIIYEAVYTAANPRVQGAGMAAIRDLVSFMKHQSDGLSILGDQPRYLRYAIAFGVSQCGRFLRTFLYSGMNADEKGRRVFDGVWADVAGAGRGSFNHRFAQASRDGQAYFNLHYQTDLYPFTDIALDDPITHRKEGLLDRLKPAVRPKIFYTNGSHEYWGRAAALIHVTPDGRADAPLPADTRIYFLAGTQHGSGRLPPVRQNTRYLANPVDFRPIHKALLEAMRGWVVSGTQPPDSRYPHLAKGELVPAAQYRNPAGAHPKRALPAFRLNFGPEFESKGIVTNEPPWIGPAFPALVPKPDADGIDLGGIRMPEAANPLGALTGWNFRSTNVGAPNEPAALIGAFLPMSATAVRARYGQRNDYVERATASANTLIRNRFMLIEDQGKAVARAVALYDAVVTGRLK
ncbi:MAG TPA: alpha/beta hydrolase domain-containing protein [Bryobacteraceae bacterium]|nr:alpha/beta hydrolase domain-containing protein [Bryobacteraceae bacterium]